MYHKWNAGELIAFVSEHGFTPMKHRILYEGAVAAVFSESKEKSGSEWIMNTCGSRREGYGL